MEGKKSTTREKTRTGHTSTHISGDGPKGPPTSARVSIYEVTLRPWGELTTDA
jgi:hypothetical protein